MEGPDRTLVVAVSAGGHGDFSAGTDAMGAVMSADSLPSTAADTYAPLPLAVASI